MKTKTCYLQLLIRLHSAALYSAIVLAFSGCTKVELIGANQLRSRPDSSASLQLKAPLLSVPSIWYVSQTGSIPIGVNSAGPSITGLGQNPGSTTLSITAATNGSRGTTSVSGGQVTYIPNAGSYGQDSFTVTVADSLGASSTATVTVKIVTPYTWTGNVSATWDNATGGNWCGTLKADYSGCNNDGAVPAASDIAIIDDTCSGANCNVTTNYAITVKGLVLGGSSLTLGGGFALTTGQLGVGGFTWSGGALNAGSSTIKVKGPYTYTGGTANWGSSTLIFSPQSGNATVTNLSMGSITYGNVVFGGSEDRFDLGGTSVHVGGLLTLGDTNMYGQINNGFLVARGGLTVNNHGYPGNATVEIGGTADQSITCSGATANLPSLLIGTNGNLTFSGNCLINGNYTYNYAGTINWGSSTLTFARQDSTLTYLSMGSITYGNLSFSGNAANYSLFGGTVNVGGLLTLGDASNYSSISNGTLVAQGGLTVNNQGAFGNSVVQIGGAADQTITCSGATANLPLFTINTTGNLTFSGNCIINGTYTYQNAGTINWGGSTLTFWSSTIKNLTMGSVTYGNITFTGSSAIYDLGGGTVNVGGLLTFGDQTTYGQINHGTLVAQGGVTANNVGFNGSAVVQIGGNADQTITCSGASARFPSVVINTTGNLTFSGNCIINGTYAYQSAGTITWGGSTLTFWNSALVNLTMGSITYGNITFTGSSGIYNLGGGTVNVGGLLTLGDITMYGQINNGTLAASGDVVINSFGFSGTANIILQGATNSTWTQSAGTFVPGNSLQIAKGANTMTLATAMSLASPETLQVASGTLNMAGYDLTVPAGITNSGTLQRGTNPTCGTITGAVSGTAAVCP